MTFEQHARLFRENARLRALARNSEGWKKANDKLRAALERIVNHPRLPLIVRTIAHNALNEETKWAIIN